VTKNSAGKTPIRAALVILAAAAGAAVAAATHTAPAAGDVEAARRALGISSTVRDGFRYEFHALSGQERLFDLGRDPGCLVDVASSHAELVRACRQEVLESLGASSLEELRAPCADTIRRLEAMGYL
jgi:hypothetical protein